MKERPILMTPESAQKCHDGTKTQMRRIVKYSPILGEPDYWCSKNSEPVFMRVMGDYRRSCPYGFIGDRLWVRERWAWTGEKAYLYQGNPADARIAEEWNKWCRMKWTPSIHMPRLACRTVVKIIDVRVERLQDISEEDAVAEGVTRDDNDERWNPIRAYKYIWESINGKGSWELDPWVWVLSFKKVEGSHDYLTGPHRGAVGGSGTGGALRPDAAA
jgi:hypothetical protein